MGIMIANTQLNNAVISGEYITIYQYQRQQQKLNLAEKEQQLQALSRDRAELKTKLNELQALLKNFLVHDKVFSCVRNRPLTPSINYN